jgi:transposase
MYTKQEVIIRSYREGKSQRRISRELSINRKTVKKYISEYEERLSQGSCMEQSQSSYLSEAPSYKGGMRGKIKLTEEVIETIDGLLELNQHKKEQGLRKQMLKKKDILEELHRQGFDIGYTTVCNYITTKTLQSTSAEAFIRQSYQPGESCEFDWGEVKLNIDGCQTKLQLAVFTSAYSNHRYAFIYNRQDTLSFMDSHVRYFDAMGGVYHLMVYDNMRVAVSRFIGLYEKEPTKALLELRGYYGFSHRFCNTYRANEKGHVERSVEYVRRKAFALRDSFENIQDAQAWLIQVLDKLNHTKQKGTGKSAAELLGEEKKVLGILPVAPLVCAEQIQLRVDKYATVSHRTNRYSVSDELVGKFVDVFIHADKLRIYYQNKQVATHGLNFGKHRWIIDIEHYLSTFKRKPGALAGSVALASSSYLRDLYQNHFKDEPREFIDFLSYCQRLKINQEKLEESVRRLTSNNVSGITIEKLRVILDNRDIPSKVKTENDEIFKNAEHQLMQFENLMSIQN